MRILQVIHGYPPRYNAGSEIYTQSIAQGLARRGHRVTILTREEDPLRPDYEVRTERDPDVPEILLSIVNMPRSRDRFRHAELDRIFASLLQESKPDVVHIGHLNHLSTGVVEEAHRAGVPIVFTLHDFWLMCPRGQFIQYGVEKSEPWALCDGQNDLKCATKCYASRYESGLPGREGEDIDYWRTWVGLRMTETRQVANFVSLFIAPSRMLQGRFQDEFAIPAEKLVYLDYGFDLSRFSPRRRKVEDDFVFGYIGTHKPGKGVHLLVDAAASLSGRYRVRIWGQPTSDITPALKARVRHLPNEICERIEWMGEYATDKIVQDVFDWVDAIVVPSIWLENSPLVIHEAQQVRVPVIASNLGGMAEYVKHEVNGLVFTPRDAGSLAAAMQRMIDNPGLARKLGSKGYLFNPTGGIPGLEEHISSLLQVYENAVSAP
jgi:glycosyltransferase involved in cell wall biosynthesis